MEFNSELLSSTKTNKKWNTKLVKHCSKQQDKQLVDEIFLIGSSLSLINYEENVRKWTGDHWAFYR